MQIRNPFVGVDAALSPHAAHPFFRYVEANLSLRSGRTEASAPTRHCTVLPLVVQVWRCTLRGRGKPRPYGTTGSAVEKIEILKKF